MATSTACVGPTNISVTGLTETAIGTSWTVPSGARCIKGIRGQVACATVHDAVLTSVPRVRLTSADVSIEPAEILLEVPGSSPVTHGSGESMWESTYYALNIPVKGGETIYFYGTQYVTTTTALTMSLTVYFSTEGASGPQYHYKAAAATYATTVTAAAAHINPTTYRITNCRKITAAFGVVWQTTSTAAVGCIGKFELTSSDFKTPFGIGWMSEGGSGILSVGDLAVHVSKVGLSKNPDEPDLDIPVNSICNITENFTNGPTNIVGAYVTGVQYI